MKTKIKTCPYKNVIIGVLCGVAAVLEQDDENEIAQ